MALPVNLMNVQAATGFDYPPGRYLLQVESTEIRTNNDGNGQRLLVHNVIVMGPGPVQQFSGRKIANSYQLTDKGAPFLKRFFVSCGIGEDFINQNGGQVEESWLPGRQYVAQVAKNGNYTNITNERPVSEWNNGQDGAAGNQAAAAARPAAAPSPTAPALLAPNPQPMVPPVAYAPAPSLPPPGAGIPVGIPAPVPPPGRVGQ